MYTATNLLQATLYLIAALSFWLIGFKYYRLKQSGMRLFGIALVAMGIVQFCALGVTMLWQFLSINFKSLEYLVYIFAIILFFASAADSLKPKTRKLTWVFLIIISIIVAGLYLINPVLSGPDVYSARYVLSFDNPTTINLFALIVALSFGLATLTITPKFKDKLTKQITEGGFLIIIIGSVLNILSYSDTTKLIANIVTILVLVLLAIYYWAVGIKVSKLTKK